MLLLFWKVGFAGGPRKTQYYKMQGLGHASNILKKE